MNDETHPWFDKLKDGEFSIVNGDMYWHMFKTMARIDKYKREEEFYEPLIVVYDNKEPLEVNTPNACSLMSEPIIVMDEGDDFLGDVVKDNRDDYRENEVIEVFPFKVELHLSSLEKYFERTPLVLSCSNPSPSHDSFSQSYDKLKRFLSMIYLSFNLLLSYSCFV